MNCTHVTLTAAAAAAAVIAAAGIALASGGPPPVQPADPAVDTVVSTATAQSRVRAPAPDRRSNATIERAVQAARARALPRAVSAARTEADTLAAAAGLHAGAVVGIRRDSSPLGYWDQDAGRFGPGVWCGRVFSRRTVRQADGTTKRVTASRHRCPVPKTASIRVTLTFAARPR